MAVGSAISGASALAIFAFLSIDSGVMASAAPEYTAT